MRKLIGVLKAIGITLGAIALYLLFVTFGPGFSVPPQPLGKQDQISNEADMKPPVRRRDVSFEVNGTSLSAWLYLPVNLSVPIPCIVMGHGFGGTKEMLLESYAVRYQEAGFAVLVFDYRHFGESGGEPRQLLWVPYQLEDWSASIAYARGLAETDPERIALWGTSAGGGHAIVTAARDHRIACVIAQSPGLDGRASGEMLVETAGLRHMLRTFVHGQRDMVRGRLGLLPHRIPIVGKPGSIALFPVADAYEGYSRFAAQGFRNEVCARIILRGSLYRPVEHAENVRCPVLLQICENDSLTPAGAARETEKRLGEYANARYYPIGHFDIYWGSNFERAVRDQLEFLMEYLY